MDAWTPRRDVVVPFPVLRARFQEDPRVLLNCNPGVVVVDKPAGRMTSHDVIDRARRCWRERKIGHAGTLDPLASGVLILLLGNATRLFDDFQRFPKQYRADFRLGERTDTQDRLGVSLTPECWSPHRLPPVEQSELDRALSAFRGDILQVPPMFSALKRDGRPLYMLARKGETVERTPRPVRVDTLSVENFDGLSGTLAMTVSSGFYVRTLVDDLGVALGCGAVMTELRRTMIGPFGLDDAIPSAVMGRE